MLQRKVTSLAVPLILIVIAVTFSSSKIEASFDGDFSPSSLQEEICQFGAGDGQHELIARGAVGMQVHKYDIATNSWTLLTQGDPAWSDAGGWDNPEYYSTIQTMDAAGCKDKIVNLPYIVRP